jgi:hypothetical protein
MIIKVCAKCKIDLPIESFYVFNRGKYGTQTECKRCQTDNLHKYAISKIGLPQRMYLRQRRNCRERKHEYPNYNVKQLRIWLLSHPIYHELYDNWVESGYKKDLIPSCDRKDNNKTYAFDNIRICTWKENREHCYSDMRLGLISNLIELKPVIQISNDNKIISRYISVSEAGRELRIKSSIISYICLDRYGFKSAKGFKFMHAYEPIKTINI